MAEIQRLAQQFRAELLAHERAAATEMVQAYGAIWVRLREELDAVTQAIQQRRRQGLEPSPAWLYRQERYRRLLEQARAAFQEYAQFAEQSVVAQQQTAVALTGDHALQLTLAGLGDTPPGVSASFTRLNRDAVRDLVGITGAGTPVGELFATFGATAAQQIREELITGLALGRGPRETAARMREALGGNLTRSLVIARTETLRAYREANIRTYAENSDVVEEWVWAASLSTRTCAMCWAMHGKAFPLSTPFGSHPNCRCVPVPRTKSWKELGFSDIPDTRPTITPGPQAFAQLSAEKQRQILGDRKFELYQSGELTLEDLVGYRNDSQWGPVRWERSLKSVEEDLTEEERNYRRQRRKLLFSWVRGSSRRDSVLLKIAVKEEFGLLAPVWKRGKRQFTPEEISEARAVVRRMYQETQALFREQGLQSVRLYRGVQEPQGAMGTAESWTSSMDVAAKFAGFGILEETIPVRSILTHSRAPGWVNGPHGEEFEHVVLGGWPDEDKNP